MEAQQHHFKSAVLPPFAAMALLAELADVSRAIYAAVGARQSVRLFIKITPPFPNASVDRENVSQENS